MQNKTTPTVLIFRIFIIFLFSAPAHLFSQGRNGTPGMTAPFVLPDVKHEEIYAPNGEYKLLINGQVRIHGHHQKKIKTGEFIYYYSSGQIEKKENYLDGLLHGPYIEYIPGAIPSVRREYYKGKKVNYEYQYYNSDTTFMAGPYLKEEARSGMFIILFNNRQPQSNGTVNMKITYDTVFFEGNSLKIHHYSFSKTAGKVSKDFSVERELKTDNESYTSKDLEALVFKIRRYSTNFLPSHEMGLTNYYNESGVLTFKSDSGYTVNYYPDSGRLKDSVFIAEEGKIGRKGYTQNGELLYTLRMDKFSPEHTTRSYYDKNKVLIYEITANGKKPEKVKLYSDSVRKKNPAGVLVDAFETYYVYNPTTLAIDTSMTRMEYNYRKRLEIPEGRYFMIGPKGKQKRMYRVIEIHGDRYKDYGVDSTLAQLPGKGSRSEIYQNDSVSFLVQENYYDSSNPKEEKYLIRKLLLSNGKLYMVHNQVHTLGVYDKEALLHAFDTDTLPNLKTELIPEKEFKKVLARKPVSDMKKKECLKWLKTCEAINALNEKNKSIYAGNNNYFYSMDVIRRVYLYEFYRMGYNPYIPEAEYADWLQSLNLSPEELNKAVGFLKQE